MSNNISSNLPLLNLYVGLPLSMVLWYHSKCAVASRLISLGAAFRDTLTVVVPEKWLCHSGHANRFCYVTCSFWRHCGVIMFVNGQISPVCMYRVRQTYIISALTSTPARRPVLHSLLQSALLHLRQSTLILMFSVGWSCAVLFSISLSWADTELKLCY